MKITNLLDCRTWMRSRADSNGDPATHAPRRIRTAAKRCVIFGAVAILVGVGIKASVPAAGCDLSTETMDRLADVAAAVAWLGATMLFLGAAILRALADILDQMRDTAGAASTDES